MPRQTPPSAPRRPVLLGLACAVVCAFCNIAVAVAQTPAERDAALSLGEPAVRGEYLCVDFEVTGLLGGTIDEALESGLPATLLFEWRIHRRRSGWWDEEVGGDATYFRVFYDVLDRRYDVFDHRGRPLASGDDAAAIETALNGHHRLRLVRAEHLDPGGRYFIEVLARSEALDEADIEMLEDWLQGRSAGGGSLLSGLSRRAVGWLKDLVGPGQRTAGARCEFTLPE